MVGPPSTASIFVFCSSCEHSDIFRASQNQSILVFMDGFIINLNNSEWGYICLHLNSMVGILWSYKEQQNNTVVISNTTPVYQRPDKLSMRLWHGMPLDRRGRDGGKRKGWEGKDDMRSRESLTDVAKGSVLRVVENRRGGGGVKKGEG